MSTASNRPASSRGTTLFAAVTFLVVAILVIAAPRALPADSAQTGVLLVGP
jgi:hypothetical protein